MCVCMCVCVGVLGKKDKIPNGDFIMLDKKDTEREKADEETTLGDNR